VAKFDCNERVIFRDGGTLHRGRVTAVEPHKRRIVTDSGQRVIVSVRRLSTARDRVLILETRLDRNLRSVRSYGPMMQQWLRAYKVEALYERVHTVDAMRRFLRHEGKNANTRFVHIMGHGLHVPGGHAVLQLTFEELNLFEEADVFSGLHDKVLLFSCCDIGGDLDALRAVKEASGAAAVIAYRMEIPDCYTNLAEVLLYEILLSKPATSPKRAVETVANALKMLDVKVEGFITRKPVLVCV